MSEKEESKFPVSCPSCNEPIPDDAPGGICPKCALAEAAAPVSDPTLPMTGTRFDPPSTETLANSFPQLEILELIGCGGMGAVYLARQPNLDRPVALKILSPALAESPSFTERFSREGRLLARLNHPNIVGVHDFGESGGFFFLIMEYVDGVNLRQAMRAGRFTPEQAIEVVPKICEALQFAHDEGVLHRDIKPENILLDEKGRVKIADFGIAKLLGEPAPDAFSLTGTSMPGTPQYMAPEQIEHPGDVDHRADIFSLGVVFYEMLTGELPMGRFAAPSEKTAVNSQIDEIVFRALEKERDRRQQSAEEVKTDIEGVSVADLARLRHPGYGEPPETSPTPPKGKAAAGIVIAGFLSFFLLGIPFWAQMRSEALENAELHAKREHIQAKNSFLNAQIESLRKEMQRNPDDPAIRDQWEAVSNEQENLLGEHRDLQKRQGERIARAGLHLWRTFPVFLLASFALLVIGIVGTIAGWRSLRRIRILENQNERSAAMFAALFWPLVLLTVIVFALIALPLSQGPRWVAGLGLSISVIASGISAWIAVSKTRTWLTTPPSTVERSDAVAVSAGPIQWEKWTTATLFGIVGLYAIALFGSFAEGMPGFFEILMILLLFGFIGFTIFRIWKRSPQVETVPPRRSNPKENPWPRRIFWLILCLFALPILYILLGLLMPLLALPDPPAAPRIIESQP